MRKNNVYFFNQNIIKIKRKVTMVSNLSKKTIDDELNSCLNDMKAVDQVLDEHLTLLAENVDQGFLQLKELGTQISIAANQIAKMGHPKFGSVVAISGVALTSALGAYNEVKAAYEHNKELDRLLTQKVKIAKEKKAGIELIRETALCPYHRLQKLLVNEFEHKYNEQDLLDNPENTEVIVGEIARVCELYKTSRYSLTMVDYLIAEYNAWLNFQQKSDLPRPIMAHVNNELYVDIFELNNKKRYNLCTTITRNEANGEISGAELLFLADPSITSCYLLPFAENSEVISDLDFQPNGIAEVLLCENTAYINYKERLSKANELKNGTKIMVALILVLSIVFDYFCFGWIGSWWAFFRWLTYILVVGVELAILCVVGTSYDKEDQKKNCEEAACEQLDLMGYVEVHEPDLEKKNLLTAGVDGILKNIFG
ncbi:hypothetical protein BFS16_12230 [Hoylesella timonensis]|uniref:Uncharacterized protein n=1 Tax=Hoylesella timonensis TaxID=386414 RepID=A0A2K0X9L4_9BACT|nr:hypothetical protein [Hoylesella timonensis]PNP91225.1 hypothetical protein BFS16_12230 [Hoylesella timonensis]